MKEELRSEKEASELYVFVKASSWVSSDDGKAVIKPETPFTVVVVIAVVVTVVVADTATLLKGGKIALALGSNVKLVEVKALIVVMILILNFIVTISVSRRSFECWT